MTNRKTQKIVYAVNLMARLPGGDCPVFILGAGNESNNLGALTSWIEGQKDLLAMEQPDFLVERLLHRLHNRLDAFSVRESF